MQHEPTRRVGPHLGLEIPRQVLDLDVRTLDGCAGHNDGSVSFGISPLRPLRLFAPRSALLARGRPTTSYNRHVHTIVDDARDR
jgi:hypothetical protein